MAYSGKAKRRIAAGVKRAERIPLRDPYYRGPRDVAGPAPAGPFWARITASTLADSPAANRWLYAFVEVTKATAGYGGWTSRDGGRTGATGNKPARNVLEDGNAATGIQMNGPAPAGAIVRMHAIRVNGQFEYWFGYPGGGVVWGKATADWSSGNTVSLHPCDADGSNEDAETTITGYLISPTGAAPAAANVSTGDVLGYLPFGDNLGVIVNADLGSLPAGDATNQMLYWDNGTEEWKLLTAPDASYKVLQRKSDGTLHWDYPKYT
ncbi:MAG TPA: hypothetical protein VMW52_03775 [Phycisphaerae bacterium]|nr:hypothetical protein [Phycisphaerae bacterium]